ncbi:hypothetical protein CVT25_003954, partial [Psilocybe cyanescens]
NRPGAVKQHSKLIPVTSHPLEPAQGTILPANRPGAVKQHSKLIPVTSHPLEPAQGTILPAYRELEPDTTTSRGGTFSANYDTDDSGERTPTSDVQPTSRTPGLSSGEEYFTDASEPSEPSETSEQNETQMVDQMAIDTPKTRELSLNKPTPFNGE